MKHLIEISCCLGVQSLRTTFLKASSPICLQVFLSYSESTYPALTNVNSRYCLCMLCCSTQIEWHISSPFFFYPFCQHILLCWCQPPVLLVGFLSSLPTIEPVHQGHFGDFKCFCSCSEGINRSSARSESLLQNSSQCQSNLLIGCLVFKVKLVNIDLWVSAKLCSRHKDQAELWLVQWVVRSTLVKKN